MFPEIRKICETSCETFHPSRRLGAPGQPPQATRFLLNQVLVKSGGAWRVMSIFPIPAPVQ